MRAVVFGASGGIGTALVDQLSVDGRYSRIDAGSRSATSLPEHVSPFAFDLSDEASIAAAARDLAVHGPIQLVLVASGWLSEPGMQPEKSWAAQSAEAYAHAFAINTTGPALIGKHLLPLLDRRQRSAFAVISAKVGSIGDNRLGGWHAYRASKAALNMIVRNFAIELAHRNPAALAVTLHPGTVATPLSAPFTSRRDPADLFEPALAARQLLAVVDGLTPADSGGLFSWDGTRLPY